MARTDDEREGIFSSSGREEIIGRAADIELEMDRERLGERESPLPWELRNYLEEIARTTSLGRAIGLRQLETISEAYLVVLEREGMALDDLTEDLADEIARQLHREVFRGRISLKIIAGVGSALVVFVERRKPEEPEVPEVPGESPPIGVPAPRAPLVLPVIPLAQPGDVISAEHHNALRRAVLDLAEYISRPAA